jgi:hypothetical protein
MAANSINTMLASHGSQFRDIVVEGFQYYQSQYAQQAADHSKRSRASLIHDHMIAIARQRLPASFHYIEHQQREIFTYGDEAVVQLKRLDADMKPRNFLTSACYSLYSAGEMEGLPGILTSLPFITIGYLPDQFWRHPLGIFATQIVNFNPSWIRRLDEPDSIQPELPIPIQPYDPDRKSKARLKTPGVSRRIDFSDSGNSQEARAG